MLQSRLVHRLFMRGARQFTAQPAGFCYVLMLLTVQVPHWCPGSDIRTMPRRLRLRMSEPKGHQQTWLSRVVLDL